MANSIQESINNAINTIVNQRIDALELDKTVIGVIDSVVDSTRSIYKIKCNGGFFNARSLESNAIYLPGMSVYVQIPQNDMTKEKLIISRATSLLNDDKVDVVVSAINNFAILGNNVAKSNIGDKELAIRSYHNPIVEMNYPETIEHRAKLLYKIDQVGNNYDIDWDTFNLYKENATALMIEAEFRTSLDSAQRRQYTGEYGLNINAVFQNSDYQYGETQGQIFDYFAGNTKATDTEGNTLVLAEKDTRIQEILSGQSDVSIADFLKDDGYLDQYIYEINNLITVYAENNKAIYIPVQEENNSTYILMLKELKLLSTYSDMKTAYNNWRNLAVAPPENKIVSLTLDSNHMTGTPFYFTSWTSQYAIFEVDLSKFKYIDSIVFYKNGFNLDEEKCEAGINTGKGSEPKEDLFIRNLKIYALQPISAIYGDYRLEIQSPDGLIFEDLSSTENLTINAKLTKAYYEDLSTKAAFRWFKKSKNVVNVSSNGYNQYGGIGWEYLEEKSNKQYFSTNIAENMAYENTYKCVAKIDDTIVLSQEFTIYNKAFNSLPIIESDLGTRFSFDSGEPIFTCKIKEGSEEYKEIISDDYKYYWAIVVNGQRTFLTGEQIKISLSNLASAVEANRIKNMLRNVKFFNGDTEIDLTDQEHLQENVSRATRIQYPMSNLLDESVIIIECYVDKKYDNKYYDIGNASLSIQNSADALVGTYKIVIENGEQLFQYDEYGNAPNAKKLKSPQEILPLICHLYNPAGLEVPNSHYTVNWTVPIEDTLIAPSSTLQFNPADNLVDLDINKQFVFNIAQVYNESYQNNQVICQVIYNDLVLNKETNFYFGKMGSNGTNGTDMVLRILSKYNHANLDNEPLTLYRYNYDSKNQVYKNIWFNDNKTDAIIAAPVSGHIEAQLYQKNIEVNAENILWNVAGNTQMYTNKEGKFLEISNGGNTDTQYQGKYLTWKESFNKTKLDNYIIRAQAEYEGKTYYAFYGLPQIIYNATSLPKYTRIAINKKTLLKEIVYNADGRNPIYNHSAGVELINVPENYSIEWTVENSIVNGSRRHEPDFLLLEERDKKNGVSKITADKGLKRVYILPNDNYNGSNNDNLVVAKVISNNTLIAIVIVPIHMSLNTFGLASLNAWDGNTVTIDNDNGYVMAPQVGAGEKDKNNRFTGILMGKTETYTGKSEKEKETGLFGYAHGLQSIFLDADTGNATFGLPDGQILVQDGNTLKPIDSSDDNDYTEGRIELRPGDVSTIGGWHLGRRALYYTQTGKLSKRTIKDWTPNNKGVLGQTTTYYEKHEKDIASNDVGLLLYAGNTTRLNPYISIKGRKLLASKGEIVDDLDSQIADQDSIEILLDPQTPTLFTVFRHNGPTRGDKAGSRTFLAGINSRGELVANAVQAVVTGGNDDNQKEIVTKSSVTYLKAFRDTQESAPSYIGATYTAGSYKFLKMFIDKGGTTGPTQSSTLYITGGESATSEYLRSISIHGNTIGLYARDSRTNNQDNNYPAKDIAQQARVLISSSQFYGGNTNTSHIDLRASGDSSNITTIGQNTIKGSGLELKTTSGDINLRTNNDNDANSYLKLDANGSASLLGASSLYGYARNGNVGIYARNNSANRSYLTMNQDGASTLVGYNGLNLTATNGDAVISAKASLNFSSSGGPQLYLPVASVSKPSLLTAATGLEITSTGLIKIQANNNNEIQLNANGIGGIAIQKGTGDFSGHNYLHTDNLGLYCNYGYFTGTYNGSNSIYSSNNINSNTYVVRENGAYSYIFNSNQTISYGEFSVTGGSIGALLRGILESIDGWKDSVDSSLSSIAGDIGTLQGNVNTLSGDINSLSNDFNNHKHKYLDNYGSYAKGPDGAQYDIVLQNDFVWSTKPNGDY